jgi:hypothetical protein
LKAEKFVPGDQIAADPPKPGEFPPGFEAFGPAPDVASLAAEPLPRDTQPPNGSSIAFIAQYEERRILLTGDARPDVIAAALSNLPYQDKVFHLGQIGPPRQPSQFERGPRRRLDLRSLCHLHRWLSPSSS